MTANNAPQSWTRTHGPTAGRDEAASGRWARATSSCSDRERGSGAELTVWAKTACRGERVAPRGRRLSVPVEEATVAVAASVPPCRGLAVRVFPDAVGRDRRHPAGMSEQRGCYAVAFREEGGVVAAGRLELADDRLLISGANGGQRRELTIAFAEIVDVHVGRLRGERLNGYPTIVLERELKPAVQFSPIGAGFLHEIADLLIRLTAAPAETDELAVIVPLRAGSLGRVRELLALGPPVDPSSLDLTSHQVYLREQSAIFVFSGPDVRNRVRRAMRSPALWRAGLAWRDCIAGQPRIDANPTAAAADGVLAYHWQREHHPEGRRKP